MGQAKRRGTLDQRIEQSISSCKEIMDKLLLKPSEQEMILKQSPSRQKHIIHYVYRKKIQQILHEQSLSETIIKDGCKASNPTEVS